MEIGDKIRFIPSAFIHYGSEEYKPPMGVPVEVTGTVDYINAPHRWYRVRYEVYGIVGHEGFKY